MLSEKEKNGMKLVYMPDGGNWYYTYYQPLNCIFYVAKTEECDSGVFGNIRYFRNWLKKEIEKDFTITGKLTALGFKILNGGMENDK